MPKAIFYAFNIKIKSEEQYLVTPYKYEEYLKRVFETKTAPKYKGETYLVIRRLHSQIIDNVKVYTGKISRFTKVEGKWLDFKNNEAINYEIPKDVFPNLKETEFIFIPEDHRFCFLSSSEVSVPMVDTFLRKSFKQISDVDEYAEVIAEKSSDLIDLLYNAKYVYMLEIDISYTNDDNLPRWAQIMDEAMKDSNVGGWKNKYSPVGSNPIDISNNQIIQDQVIMSQSNGVVRSTILDEETGKKRTIDTNDHPHKFKQDVPFDTTDDKIIGMFVGIRKFLEEKNANSKNNQENNSTKNNKKENLNNNNDDRPAISS